MYTLIDCNNFYASCERVFRPDLNNKPIVVLSNNDGCVIARSNESKALGVPMGALAYEYKDLFTKENVEVFSANFALYGDMSNRVMSILSEYSPDIEIYSIDELFLKLNGFELFDLKSYGLEMKNKVKQWTGIPISVGMAPTKALSKVANKIAKKFPIETQGVHIIDTEEKRIKALKWLPVEDIWGVGRQYAKRLKEMDVHTALDFINLSDNWVRKNMDITGLRLKHDLAGVPTLNLEEIQSKKSIATTRSFEYLYTTLNELKERISTFAITCSEKLRHQKECCSTIMVFIQTNYHRKDLPQYSRNFVLKLPFPTNSAIEITKFALKSLEMIFKDGFHYKRAGVVLMDFCKQDEKQLFLFENSNPKHEGLMNAMDLINKRHGQQKIKLASQDIKRVWKMKQERLSPRYTTNLNEIIEVH